MNIDDILKGDFKDQSYSADFGIMQMYLLMNTIETNITLQAVLKNQFEINQLIATGTIDDEKTKEKLTSINEKIAEICKKDFLEKLAHAAASSKD